MPLEQYLASIVRERLDQAAAPGAAVAVLVDGRPFFEAGVGYCDVERTRALPSDAQFYIYSVTKSLIAILVLQLVEQGPVAVEAPIQTYLPTLELPAPVTIRQLLNHTGGLPDYGSLQVYKDDLRADPAHPWTEQEFLDHTLASGLLFPPETGWGYSNIGFMLLKLVIQAVTQQSFRTVVHERIVAPLQLEHTFVAETLDDTRSLTPGYSTYLRTDDTLEDISSRYHPGWVSHGVVISTAPELARIFDALATGRLLSPAFYDLMQTSVIVPGSHPLFRQTAYGLGVMIDPRSPYSVVVGHRGGGPGYSSAAFIFPNVAGRRAISVTLVNRDRPDLELEIAFGLVDALAIRLSNDEV